MRGHQQIGRVTGRNHGVLIQGDNNTVEFLNPKALLMMASISMQYKNKRS
jgi:hypothetical protein